MAPSFHSNFLWYSDRSTWHQDLHAFTLISGICSITHADIYPEQFRCIREPFCKSSWALLGVPFYKQILIATSLYRERFSHCILWWFEICLDHSNFLNFIDNKLTSLCVLSYGVACTCTVCQVHVWCMSWVIWTMVLVHFCWSMLFYIQGGFLVCIARLFLIRLNHLGMDSIVPIVLLCLDTIIGFNISVMCCS